MPIEKKAPQLDCTEIRAFTFRAFRPLPPQLLGICPQQKRTAPFPSSRAWPFGSSSAVFWTREFALRRPNWSTSPAGFADAIGISWVVWGSVSLQFWVQTGPCVSERTSDHTHKFHNRKATCSAQCVWMSMVSCVHDAWLPHGWTLLFSCEQHCPVNGLCCFSLMPPSPNDHIPQ